LEYEGTSGSWASPILNKNAREQYAILPLPSSSLTVCTGMTGAPVSSHIQGRNRSKNPRQNVSGSAAAAEFLRVLRDHADGKSDAARRK